MVPKTEPDVGGGEEARVGVTLAPKSDLPNSEGGEKMVAGFPPGLLLLNKFIAALGSGEVWRRKRGQSALG